MNYPLQTAYYLTLQIMKLGVYSSTPSSSGSGIYMWLGPSRFLFLSLYLLLCGNSCNQLAKKEKTQIFCIICRYHLKVDNCSSQPLSGTSLKDSSEGKSSQQAGLWTVHLGCAPQKEYDWKIDDKDAAEQIHGYTSLNGQKKLRYLFSMWILIKESTLWRRISIFKWIGWPILWTMVSLFF